MGGGIEEQLVALTGRHFDGPAFTRAVRDLAWASRLEVANGLIDEVVARGMLPNNHYRVLNARSVTKGVSSHIASVRERVAADPARYELAYLDIAQPGVDEGIPRTLDPSHPSGRTVNFLASSPLSTLTIGDLGLPDDTLRRLVSAGFATHRTPTIEVDEVWIERNCRVSAGGAGSMTVMSGSGHYLPDRSGRIAKASRLNLFEHSDKNLAEALVLPFPHAPDNYYHSLIEMTYGLRHLSRISESCPIVHGEDRFGILPIVANALAFDPARLVRAESMHDTLIETAYLPGVNPFNWSSGVVQFFRRIARRMRRDSAPSAPRVYISRRGSSRSPSYEVALESWLSDRGFRILRSEQLSVADQISIFANAECIVTHHGAGLANIAFCKDDVQIVEIFDEAMLAPDFYQRSRFVTDRYFPIVGSATSVVDDVDRVL